MKYFKIMLRILAFTSYNLFLIMILYISIVLPKEYKYKGNGKLQNYTTIFYDYRQKRVIESKEKELLRNILGENNIYNNNLIFENEATIEISNIYRKKKSKGKIIINGIYNSNEDFTIILEKFGVEEEAYKDINIVVKANNDTYISIYKMNETNFQLTCITELPYEYDIRKVENNINIKYYMDINEENRGKVKKEIDIAKQHMMIFYIVIIVIIIIIIKYILKKVKII